MDDADLKAGHLDANINNNSSNVLRRLHSAINGEDVAFEEQIVNDEVQHFELGLNDETAKHLKLTFGFVERYLVSRNQLEPACHLVECFERVNKHTSLIDYVMYQDMYLRYFQRLRIVERLISSRKSNIPKHSCAPAHQKHKFWPLETGLRPLPPPQSNTAKNREKELKLYSKKTYKRPRHRFAVFYDLLGYFDVQGLVFMTEMVCKGFRVACDSAAGSRALDGCWANLGSIVFKHGTSVTNKHTFLRTWLRTHAIIGMDTCFMGQCRVKAGVEDAANDEAASFNIVHIPPTLHVTRSLFGNITLLEDSERSKVNSLCISSAIYAYAVASAPCIVRIERSENDEETSSNGSKGVLRITERLKNEDLTRLLVQDQALSTDRWIVLHFDP